MNWDHDKDGEVGFWPSGDAEGVQLVFNGQSPVTGTELLALDGLLDALGEYKTYNFLRIYYAVHVRGSEMGSMTAEELEEDAVRIFAGA